ncbi:hypothetical protein GCM10022280_20050 [Sphingomonas swuensis]|uniref:Uncharacterized protein n=1 Tax=Sphingomonas swuensis TaxID=977800 RepID=A0ABP7T219_9SPHN
MLLSLPAIFRFPWTASDFVIMGILLGSVGLGIEFLVRQSGSMFVRLGAIVAVLTAFLTIWVNLAVGMIGSEDNPYNLLFIGLLALVMIGGIWVRLRPEGMVRVTLAAAALQAALAVGGVGQDQRGAIFSGVFALFWLFSAALFRAGASR